MVTYKAHSILNKANTLFCRKYEGTLFHYCTVCVELYPFFLSMPLFLVEIIIMFSKKACFHKPTCGINIGDDHMVLRCLGSAITQTPLKPSSPYKLISRGSSTGCQHVQPNKLSVDHRIRVHCMLHLLL